MSAVATRPTTYGLDAALRKFSVAEYNQMVETGILDNDDKVELLEGWVVLKTSRTPNHDNAVDRVTEALYPIKPAGWRIRVQGAVTLSSSQPEPDVALARGSASTYETRHPGPTDLALVIEVSYTSLQRDTLDKTRIYAFDAIPEY